MDNDHTPVGHQAPAPGPVHSLPVAAVVHGSINMWAVGTAVVGTVLSAAVIALASGAIYIIVRMPQEQEKLRAEFNVYSTASSRRLERLEASDRNQDLQLTRLRVEMNSR